MHGSPKEDGTDEEADDDALSQEDADEQQDDNMELETKSTMNDENSHPQLTQLQSINKLLR